MCIMNHETYTDITRTKLLIVVIICNFLYNKLFCYCIGVSVIPYTDPE